MTIETRMGEIMAADDFETRLEVLEREARAAGDDAQVILCRTARGLSTEASDGIVERSRRTCARVLAEAEAQS